MKCSIFLLILLKISLLSSFVFADEFKVGDTLLVKSDSKWYLAKILEVKNGKYKIHYDDFGSEWDEWVKI